MLPVRSVSRRAAAIAREHGCNTVLFGAAAPLGLITPALRGAGVTRAVALTHGHEAGWAALPIARGLLRRIGDEVDSAVGSSHRGLSATSRSGGSSLPERPCRSRLITGWKSVLAK